MILKSEDEGYTFHLSPSESWVRKIECASASSVALILSDWAACLGVYMGEIECVYVQ